MLFVVIVVSIIVGATLGWLGWLTWEPRSKTQQGTNGAGSGSTSRAFVALLSLILADVDVDVPALLLCYLLAAFADLLN